jgi:phosphoserine aminotransferase
LTHRVFNFSPGPGALPLAVLEEAQRDLVALPGVGASVLEVSHRSKWFEGVLGSAEENIRKLLGVPANYRILFLQGGASLQFAMVPMNFLRGADSTAEYIVTGAWGEKALEEAKKLGTAHAAWNGKRDGYNRVPRADEIETGARAAYVHFTSNETIQGVEFSTEPHAGGTPLVCDCSSDFLGRPLDVSRYALLYAGAQKNAGPAGVTIVIVRDDFLERVPGGLPSLLDYRLLARERSLYNTPPVFAIYIVERVTRWLIDTVGGLEKMAALNRRKAGLLYNAIDGSEGFYRGHAQPDSRSMMNVTFRLASEELEKQFLRDAAARSLVELKGHRSVGGIRASLYNAVLLEAAEALAGFMQEFRTVHAARSHSA